MDDLTRKSLSEQIYDRLRHDITRKVIKCGEKIDITLLKNKLNISQTPIREALIKLEQEGLVEFVPNVGAKVITITKQEIEELFDLNSIIDCGAICLALKSDHTDDLIKELKLHVDVHAKIVDSEPSDQYWYELQQIHEVFYKFAGNSALKKIALQIQGKSDIFIGEYILSETNRHYGFEEHFMIYEAVSKRDSDRAVELMRMHWENAKQRLIQSLGV